MRRTIDDIRSNLDFVGCDNATALELCDEVERLQAELADRDAWHRAVMDEQCGQDEKHCACVPLLRREIAEARALANKHDGEWLVQSRLEQQLTEANTQIERLRDLLKRLLAKLPHERRDNTTGRCAGCGAIHWCGDGKGSDPCKPDCVLKEAQAAGGE